MAKYLNIQKNFGNYANVPVCNTIKKILIGKLISFHSANKRPLVILGVRRNNLYGHLEILVGTYNTYSISVYSWYAYQRNNLMFIGRDNKKAIRNCLKRNPKYIKWHLGKQIDLNPIRIYDNGNYYEEYIKNLN